MDQDPPAASASTDAVPDQPQTVNLDDVFDQYMKTQKNLLVLIGELFKRSEKAKEVYEAVKRLRTD